MATKVMKEAWERYCKSCVVYLCGDNDSCAYKSCSDRKWKAWDYCKNLMDKLSGDGMRFIGVSQQVFSCGFVYRRKDGVKMFMYITPSKDRTCPVSELEKE